VITEEPEIHDCDIANALLFSNNYMIIITITRGRKVGALTLSALASPSSLTSSSFIIIMN